MAHRLVRDRTIRGSVNHIEGILMTAILGARIVAGYSRNEMPLTLLLDLDGDGRRSVVIHVEDGISVGIGFAMPVRIHGVLREHFYAVR